MPSSELYTLSLHDALPISLSSSPRLPRVRSLLPSMMSGKAPAWLGPYLKVSLAPMKHSREDEAMLRGLMMDRPLLVSGVIDYADRKSTRLNSSHLGISYAVQRALHSFPTRRSSDLSLLVSTAATGALLVAQYDEWKGAGLARALPKG